MSETILANFGTGWRAFAAHPGVFITSMLALFASWAVLEIAVIKLQNLGIIVWLILHVAFFFSFSGLMVGFHRIALTAVEGTKPKLSGLVATMHRGPTLLLAALIYFLGVACGLVILIVPGIYIAVRYALFGQVVATRSSSAVESLSNAARLSRGRWWTLFVFFLLALLLNLGGAALLGVGLLLTFPLSLLATSSLYRSLPQPAS